MPLLNWEPEGSFLRPIVPPVLGPADGALVCIPPVNQDWIKIILGCLDQLRIPATWDVAGRSNLLDALNWMQELKDMVASAGPCCDVAMRLNNCVLQFSTDSGTTWQDVAGWAANFCGCVTPCVVPPIPTFPPGQVVNQHACNIAGYLASEIINKVVTQSVASFNAGLTAVQFGGQVLALIGWAFPITYLAYLAFEDYYAFITSGNIAAFTTAESDPSLWSEVTCAIYSAIRGLGYVDGSNYGTLVSNVCALSYSSPAVINAICAFLTNVGLENIQKMQTAGALDDVDCTACTATWCRYFDFTVSNQGWTQPGGFVVGSYVAGQGWKTGPSGPDFNEVYAQVDMGITEPITRVDVLIRSNQGSTGAHASDCQVLSAPLTPNCLTDFTFPVDTGSGTWQNVVVTCSGRYVSFDVATASAGAGYATVLACQIHGTGINPFGADNCVH